MIRILASDGMQADAVKALEAKGFEVTQQFMNQTSWPKRSKITTLWSSALLPRSASPSLMLRSRPAD